VPNLILLNRTILTLLILIFCCRLFAQKEGNIWYFGEKAGLSFNSGSPSALLDGQLITTEGCATISDKNGNLLFYTNGENVWNRQHQIMPNGTGLLGGYSSTQSSVIVPFPGNDSLYYIFTTAQDGDPYGFRYSVVNLKQGNGLGDVTTKNVLLLSNVYEKVSAVRQSNCPNYWVVTKKWDSDEYYAYQITSSGISSPVISATGNFTGGSSHDSKGQLKFSPDGNKVAVAYSISYDFVELMDFNQLTGILSNPLKIIPNPPRNESFSVGCYGVEFSPSSQLLYVGATYIMPPQLTTLYQYNVSYSDPLQIIASKKLINNTEFNYGMQLGPDKKIYLATFNNNYLNVINNPDVEGINCGFVVHAVSLSGLSNVGLPALIQSFFKDPIIATGNCEFQNINFSIQNSSDISAVEWNFGDPLSGAGNISVSTTPLHIYTQQGTYKVRLIYLRTGGCFADTVYKQVYAGPFKLYLGADTTVCAGDTLLLHAKFPNAVNLWSDGTADTLIKVTKPGKYWVRAILNDCWASDTIDVSFQSLPSFSLGRDTTICINSGIILSPHPGFSNITYSWNNGSTTPQIMVDQPGTYWLAITDPVGCKARDTISVSFKSLPQFNLGSDTSLCERNSLQLNANVAGATNYLWSTGATTPTINVTQTSIYWADVTKDQCVYRDSILILVKPLPLVKLGNDTTLCEDQILLLDAKNTGSNYQWQDNSNNQTFLVSKQGLYWAKVMANGCFASDTININYKLKPVFTLGRDTGICESMTIILQPVIQNPQGINYVWSNGVTSPSISITQTGTYGLTVTNLCGSKYDDIVISKGVCKIYVPSAFTPNNDGLNDIFRARFGENVASFKLQVYGRWGEKVFETNDIQKGWDGSIKGIKQSNGLYVWMIKYKIANDPKEELMKGTVMLIR
jgi:gliding motility-associated-like protein